MHEFIVQIAQKSGAAQAAPAAPLPTALISPYLSSCRPLPICRIKRQFTKQPSTIRRTSLALRV